MLEAFQLHRAGWTIEDQEALFEQDLPVVGLEILDHAAASTGPWP